LGRCSRKRTTGRQNRVECILLSSSLPSYHTYRRTFASSSFRQRPSVKPRVSVAECDRGGRWRHFGFFMLPNLDILGYCSLVAVKLTTQHCPLRD
jgi:hypothetical protein